MTLARDGGVWWVYCDYCSDSHDLCDEETQFEEVLEELSHMGWKPVRLAGEWRHMCGSCQEGENG